jgi:hypothetical protein
MHNGKLAEHLAEQWINGNRKAVRLDLESLTPVQAACVAVQVHRHLAMCSQLDAPDAFLEWLDAIAT